MPFYYDPTYTLVLIGAAICLLASAQVKRIYAKYAKVRCQSGLTGKDAAEKILRANGVFDVQVEHVAGDLTDHYNPKNKTLYLSDATYKTSSVAAVGVAAHECGHAIQHKEGYAPLRIRGALVPVARFGSMAAWPLIIIGLFINGNTSPILINLGIVLFSAAILFQLVTLPVEFNASKRAVQVLETSGILHFEEIGDTKKVLGAAALTYVASAAAMILQLIRLLLILGRSRD